MASVLQLVIYRLAHPKATTGSDERKKEILFFVPEGIYPDYPNGHWVTPKEKLFDLWQKRIRWLKLRHRINSVRVFIPNLKKICNLPIDPFWTAKQTLEFILSSTEKEDVDPQQMKALRQEELGLFLTPLDTLTGELVGFWIPPTDPLTKYDLLNQVRSFSSLPKGCLHVTKASWAVKLLHGEQMTHSTKKINLNPFWTVQQTTRYLIRVILQRTRSARDINPSDYDLFFPLTVLPESNKDDQQEVNGLSGLWMKSDYLLLDYFNKYDGLQNV